MGRWIYRSKGGKYLTGKAIQFLFISLRPDTENGLRTPSQCRDPDHVAAWCNRDEGLVFVAAYPAPRGQRRSKCSE